MANYRAGDIIRLTRSALEISQEELCDGICSVETLSRIENGHHKVKPDTYYSLMAKLERIPEKNYALCMGRNVELLEERFLLENALVKFEYEAAGNYLDTVREKALDNVVNRQYIMRMGAVLDFYNGKIDAVTWAERMKEAIRLTLPLYESYTDRIYPYTEQEILCFMNLANAYGRLEQQEKAIEIFQMLLKNIDSGYIEKNRSEVMKIAILRNYEMDLGELGRYKESTEMIQECIQLAVRQHYESILPILWGDIAWNMMQEIEEGERGQEELEDVKHLLQRAYYVAAARNDNKVVRITKNYYYEKFGEEIEEC